MQYSVLTAPFTSDSEDSSPASAPGSTPPGSPLRSAPRSCEQHTPPLSDESQFSILVQTLYNFIHRVIW